MYIACCISCDTAFHHVQEVLVRAGFVCERFLSETSLLRTIRHKNFDLVLIDTDTDSADESSIYSWLNCRTGESTPVVLLSSTYTASKIALALEAGADDCIASSFDSVELVARLHAILRRYPKSKAHRALEVRGFTLDQEMSLFLDRGVPVELTPREFTMAWLFFSAPDTYLSRETISAAIWGVDSEIASRTIEQHVYKLRKKLNLCSERGVRIHTAYTKGYRLELLDEPASQAQPQPQLRTQSRRAPTKTRPAPVSETYSSAVPPTKSNIPQGRVYSMAKLCPAA